MKALKQSHPTWWLRAQQQGLIQGPTPASDSPSPWIITVALLGAIVCAIPLLILLGLVVFDVVDESSWSWIGILLTAAAAAILRKPYPLFVTCLGLILWMVGCPLAVSTILITGEIGTVSLLIVSGIMVLLQLAGVLITPIQWVQCLMGLAAGAALYGVMLCISTWAPWLYMLQVPHLLVLLAWVAWVSTESRRLQHARPNSRASTWAIVVDAMLLGFLLAALGAAGTESVLGLALSSFSERFSLGYAFLLQQRSTLACLITAGATLWLVWRWRAFKSQAPTTLWLLLLAGTLLTVSAWFSPRLALLAVIAAGALVGARWRIAVLCGLLALLLLNVFYYTLAWTLVQKGLGLMAMGAAFLAVLLVMQRLAQPRAPAAPRPRTRQTLAPLAGIVLGALIAFTAINWDVRSKEQVIAHGARILVPLAPVDPRSLMQGDYMALRFAFPPALREALSHQAGTTVNALAQLDEKGVATVQRLAQTGESAAAGQVILPLKRLKGQWTLVTDAYFFPEGQGPFFEAARFGDFRVLPDGRALLVGLADQEGQPMLHPPASHSTSGANTSDPDAAMDPDFVLSPETETLESDTN